MVRRVRVPGKARRGSRAPAKDKATLGTSVLLVGAVWNWPGPARERLFADCVREGLPHVLVTTDPVNFAATAAS